MYPSRKLMTLIVFFQYLNGTFSLNPIATAQTQFISTKSIAEPGNFLVHSTRQESPTNNPTMLLNTTPLFARYTDGKYIQASTTATPSLLNLRLNTATGALRLKDERIHDTRATAACSAKMQRNNLSSFNLDSSRILNSIINQSKVVNLYSNNRDRATTFCPDGCRCTLVRDDGIAGDKIEMKCKTRSLKDFLRNFGIPKRKVSSLNLAQSNISSLWKNAFKGFHNLHSLNLDYNKLGVLRQGMFKDLPSLHSLSLRYNNLRKWRGYLWLDLPQIRFLNLEGNENFTSAMTFLTNTTISSIFGLSFSNSCKNCTMTRENASWSKVLPKPGSCDYLPQQYYPMAKEVLKRFILFEGKCKTELKCEISVTSIKELKKVYKNKCWEVISMLRPLVILMGVIAIAFNTVVVTVIIVTKPLRSLTALLLISHMSFCDILIGVYAVAIGDGHDVINDSDYLFRQWRRNLCPYFRTIFVFGQIMEVATSLLVTTERYFAIVFCMNPSIRVKKKNSAVFLLFFWILAAIMNYLLHVYDGASITDNYMCIIVRDLGNHEETDFFHSQGVMLLLVTLYLITMAQYCHIYIFVRKSTKNAGVRRETKLASRICIMVLTSFVFFAVPNLLMLVTTVGNISLPTSTRTQHTIIKRWLPPMFLVFNACLNPSLFAYRNDRFVKSLKLTGKKLMRYPFTCTHVGSEASCSGRYIAHVLVEESSHNQLSNAMLMTVMSSPRLASVTNSRTANNGVNHTINDTDKNGIENCTFNGDHH